MIYFNGRKQRVKIGSMFSEWQNLNADVLEGNVLRSLLFLVYINNLSTVSSILKSVLLADDSCLTLVVENYSNPINTFKSELKSLYIW